MQHLTYFDHLRIIATNWGALFVLFGLAVCFVGVHVVIRSMRNRSERGAVQRLIGGILLIVGGLVWSYLQTLVPTRYASDPFRSWSNEQVAAIAAPLYAEHCSICHGDTGRGDGPLADVLMPPPADFGIHGWHHRVGEHYWWISRGILGTSMPSFGDYFTEEERWLLARYVRQIGREVRLP